MAAAGPAARPLWRDRNFGIFWAAQTLSVAGDSFAYIAIPLLPALFTPIRQPAPETA